MRDFTFIHWGWIPINNNCINQELFTVKNIKNSITNRADIFVNILDNFWVNILNEISRSATDYEHDHTGAKYISILTKNRTPYVEMAGECASTGWIKEALNGAECSLPSGYDVL